MSDTNRPNNSNNKNNSNINNSQGYDEYQREYEQQLAQFSQLDDDSFDNENELEFQQYNNQQYRPSPNSSQYSDGRRTPASDGQRSAQRSPQQGSQRTNQRPQRAVQSNNRQQRRRPVQNKSEPHIRRDEPLQFGQSDTRRPKQQRSNYSQPKANKKNKKVKNKKMHSEKRKSPIGKFFKFIFILILVLLILLQVLIFRYLGMVNYVDNGKRNYTNASMNSSDVQNVLVIGSDTRSIEQRGRTDSMILMSINKKTKEMTMTSFMRDMYVTIPDDSDGSYYEDKINAAYVYGGAELLMDTIEYNFDIQVDRYIYIDFYSFVDIVDAVGGIELDISDDEAEGMIPPMAEQNKYLENKKGTDYLTGGGKNMTVNGNQALAYARLRYVGNADFERTDRQRTVISKIISKAKTLNPLDLDKFARVCMSNLTTNMTKTELYFLTYRAPFILGYETNQLRIPAEDAYTYGDHNGQSTLDVDFDKCKEDLKQTIYN